MKLDAKIPSGNLSNKWVNYRSSLPLVSPANKQKQDVIIVGTGLAGASAAASMAEMGHNVKAFAFRIALEERTQLLRKGGLTQPKITKMMVIVFTGYFMILLKVVIIDLEKLMFID